jgi:hypothetical protein
MQTKGGTRGRSVDNLIDNWAFSWQYADGKSVELCFSASQKPEGYANNSQPVTNNPQPTTRNPRPSRAQARRHVAVMPFAGGFGSVIQRSLPSSAAGHKNCGSQKTPLPPKQHNINITPESNSFNP